ncbi:MAG: ATP-binding protein [Dehalobacter sp. 4CP]|uniref:AAA family ATPase n=1 Tax=Dehalobacter sp. CP TaxID=2594474 RepID=UPI0013CA73E7|nr:ATP-binding protein [Dehalobacter sp. 4CP]
MIQINPYTPGAGVKPGFLAGRDNVIESAEEVLAYISAGQTHQSFIYYGLRGVGKTVLLNEIEDIAEKYEYLYEHIEISENDNFKIVIAQYLQKVVLQLSNMEKAKEKIKNFLGLLKAFTFTIEDFGEFSFDVDAISGKADTGNFQNDLTELFLGVGKLASDVNKKIAFFIDEIQYMKEDNLEALIASTHRIHQKGYPLVIFGAGLPKIAKMAGDAKSYSERLYNFVKIDSLSGPNSKSALIEPAKNQGVYYTDNAVDKIIEITDGYPYFLQEFGRQVWEYKNGNSIDVASVDSAYEKFINKLDDSFFKVRFDRATGNEKLFMFAMADLGKGPYETSAIAHKLKKTQPQISLDRANLINKGFVYTTSHGYLDFTVPQFDKFLTRIRR